ncbi:PsiF family protein [Xylophilus ampelinus]|uniref:PsiF repeat-containing protein n=1 Tax=Xylophilus ampelinus TaxID=54067 RepID=A0A318SUS4_9BURK|nr:PsiF family protein [Xylophilus ampelinus]MCS4511673.1 PsiF family protein [Xylophilus ampelinus]PYE74189.1 psiF repeat-containing protein [Xylophilus ampelinus]
MKTTNTTLLTLAAGLALSLACAVHAADAPAADAAAKPKTAQQDKMATCNTEATGKKGDERKAFMKECLAAGKATQQNKMKTCNADAKTKDLKGDARKSFMSECLKNKPAA